MPVSVPLYTQHLTSAGHIRGMIAGLKGLIDQETVRNDLIALNNVAANLTTLPYPTNIVGRIEHLSQAIRDLESTLSIIEDGIRGAVFYPAAL